MQYRVNAGLAVRELPPVQRHGPWLAWGLALQATGLAIPTAAAASRAEREGVLGSLTHYTVRLIWHEMLRSRADVALMAVGLALFAAGAIVFARPFVRRPPALLVAVPLAALAGVGVLGLVVLLVAAAAALGDAGGGWESAADVLDGWTPSRRRRRRR